MNEQMGLFNFHEPELNLGGAFDTKIGVFTVPKSGLYLLIFRGMLSHFNPVPSSPNGTHSINIGWYQYHQSSGNESENVKKLGAAVNDSFHVTSVANKYYYAEVEMMVKANRGDLIVSKLDRANKVSPQSVMFDGRSISFTGYGGVIILLGYFSHGSSKMNTRANFF